MTAPFAIAAVSIALLAAATRAEAAPPVCPSKPGLELSKLLYLFAVGRPATYAVCVYADGSDVSLPLAKGCGVEPVDAVHDGPPAGGMRECQETKPVRCRITCPPSRGGCGCEDIEPKGIASR